jgi:hypothetical protein
MAATLTTTLSELNRLYGIYVEANNADLAKADISWIDYETYARRYQSERGLTITLEPRPRT